MSVCLQRLGHSKARSLVAGRIISGWCGNAKARSLGVKHPALMKSKKTVKKKTTKSSFLRIAHMKVPVSVLKSDGSSVEDYLRRAFKDRFADVRSTMSKTAARIGREVLRENAMKYYERFRPPWRGWAVPGPLSLAKIRAIAK